MFKKLRVYHSTPSSETFRNRSLRSFIITYDLIRNPDIRDPVK
jgi:hypothetical protein